MCYLKVTGLNTLTDFSDANAEDTVSKGAMMLIHIVNDDTFTMNPNWQDTKVLMSSIGTLRVGLLFLVSPHAYWKP